MTSVAILEQKRAELDKQVREQKMALDLQFYNASREDLENVLIEIKKLEDELEIVKNDTKSFEEKAKPFKTEICKLEKENDKLVKLKISHDEYVKKVMKLIPGICEKNFVPILNAIENSQAKMKHLITEQRQMMNKIENENSKQRQTEIETKLKELSKLKTRLETEILEISEKVDPETYQKQMAKKYLGTYADLVTDFEFDGDDDAKTYFTEGYHEIDLFTMKYRLKSTGKMITIEMKSGGARDFSYSNVSIKCGDYDEYIDNDYIRINLCSEDFEECPELLPFFKAYGEETGDNVWEITDLELSDVIIGDCAK